MRGATETHHIFSQRNSTSTHPPFVTYVFIKPNLNSANPPNRYLSDIFHNFLTSPSTFLLRCCKAPWEHRDCYSATNADSNLFCSPS